MYGFLIPISIVVAAFLYGKFKRPLGSPPGPFKFPLLGNFPQLMLELNGSGLSALFSKWSMNYGPVFSVDFGSYPAVVINDARLIREAFATPQLCGRMELPVIEVRMGGDGNRRGLIFNEGQSWTDQRRFTMRHLKDFGIGKNTMEGIILDEVQDLIRDFRRDVGKPISTEVRFNVAVINSLWAIIAGERFQHDDPKLLKLVQCVIQNLSETGASGAMIFLPRLAQMFPNISGWKEYLESFEVTQGFIQDFVDARLESHQDGHLNDFTDAYIENIKKTEDTRSSFYKEEGVRNLVTVLNDMFNAGGETTSTTMTWLLLCLAVTPKVQEKFQAEIDRVIGTARLPSLSDRSRMTYTESLISEVLRVSSVVHTGVFHACLQDTLFNNFFIGKGTIIISNIAGVHHDAKLWEDPQNFRPERFLTPDEESVVGHDGLIPFSTGKRVCPGENLARDELFLMSTALFQTFEVKPDLNGPLPTLQPIANGIVAKTQPHKLVFNLRSQKS